MKASDMEYQTDHEVMSCPACHQTIKAQVSVKVSLGPLVPDVTNGEAKVDAAGRIVRFVVDHKCSGVVEGAPASEVARSAS